MKKYRKQKINEQLKRTLSELLFKDVKDPRIKGIITITQVDIASDMKFAKVFVSIYGIAEKQKEKCLQALQNSADFLKFKLSQELRLRYIPELSFRQDSSIEKGFNVIEKLDRIKERSTPSAEDDSI